MIEPTESESKKELDRFCDAMISIRDEITAIESGELDRLDNPLKNAPHTAEHVAANDWHHAYSRESAAYPLSYLKKQKYWPPVGRLNHLYGEKNLRTSRLSEDE
jgi:glycine dehydrogenase